MVKESENTEGYYSVSEFEMTEEAEDKGRKTDVIDKISFILMALFGIAMLASFVVMFATYKPDAYWQSSVTNAAGCIGFFSTFFFFLFFSELNTENETGAVN